MARDPHQDRERWSYVLLVEELRRVSSAPRADARQLFKRMVFNALISNTDDHPRNHAVIVVSLTSGLLNYSFVQPSCGASMSQLTRVPERSSSKPPADSNDPMKARRPGNAANLHAAATFGPMEPSGNDILPSWAG